MTRRRLAREVLLDAAAVVGAVCILVALAHAVLGTTLLVFRSGSMTPTISTGSLAVAVERPVSDLSPGDVVSVLDDDGVRVTHRIVSITPDGLVLKGDANPAPDVSSYDVRKADVVVASVPYAGRVFDEMSHGWWLLAQGGLAAGAVGLALRRPRRGHRDRVRTRRAGAAVAALALGLVVTGPLVRTMASWSDTAAMTGTAASNKWFTCSAAVLDLDPWLYWRFDENNASGGAADSSGHSRAGTYNGGVTFGATKACARETGRAITLNGSTGYVSSAASSQPTATAGLNTFSVGIWFKTTTNNGGRLIGFGLARTGASSQYDRHLYMTDTGKVMFGVYPGGFQSLSSADAYNDGAWHQAVGQVGAGGMKLFVDGELVASNPAITTAESYSGWWRVGYDNLNGWPSAPTSYFFSGTVDDAVVWSSALSNADVLAAYRSGR